MSHLKKSFLQLPVHLPHIVLDVDSVDISEVHVMLLYDIHIFKVGTVADGICEYRILSAFYSYDHLYLIATNPYPPDALSYTHVLWQAETFL